MNALEQEIYAWAVSQPMVVAPGRDAMFFRAWISFSNGAKIPIQCEFPESIAKHLVVAETDGFIPRLEVRSEPLADQPKSPSER